MIVAHVSTRTLAIGSTLFAYYYFKKRTMGNGHAPNIANESQRLPLIHSHTLGTRGKIAYFRNSEVQYSKDREI